MPCFPRMRMGTETDPGCKADCLHRRLVQEYKAERIRQEDAAVEASIGYATEYAEYVAEHPLITFKDWLIMTKGPEQQQVAA
ncbi:hypothetical protein HMPREF0063_10080 [Aeromicrobium marinum DSM 15272]|uniref:Uncharacterized protein n=1 Tax=Aeromicrobium marinum DSM 15272 TaxID=585531 RepID=E2S7S3_9ACTN|nr:hypothetical protein [Aeromicrobium marinum]EFQ84739.1 hypothetical protein HMPREF0063_10080 [Aeromicrobium marinum DSM 15272]